MIKHSQIINQLSVQQKVALLTDISNLDNQELNSIGVPRVSMDTLESLRAQAIKAYPPVAAMANTWDLALMEASAIDIANNAKSNGVNAILVPAAKPRCNMYAPGICEDPYLSGTFTNAFVSGVNKAGSASIIPDFSISESDIEYFDSKPSKRIIYHFFVRPYLLAAKKAKPDAVITSTTNLKDYGDVNRSFIDDYAKSMGTTVFADNYNFDDTLKELIKGNLCLKGAVASLSSAVANYQSLQRSIVEGSGTIEELNQTLEEGGAISEDMLDAAIDKLLDFADACNKPSSAQAQSAAQMASLESIVLLKNKASILPIKEHKRIAIIGDVDGLSGAQNYINGISAYARSLDFELVGHALGYRTQDARNDDLLPQAVAIAQRADIVWLFLGTDNEYESNIAKSGNLTLPANQLALINALKEQGSKTIAIVSSNYPVDMAWDRDINGVIWAPLEGTYSSYALLNVMYAKYNPSGRLSISLYEGTDDWFSQIKENRDNGRNKVGQFIGYYNYDSSNISVRYPFGYGLSYTTFAYSKFNVKGKEVSFTITNTGTMPGKETAQIYVGNASAAVMSPNKELKAFVQIKLNPGESKEVAALIQNLEFYDNETGNLIEQGGTYDVYIGSSVSNIKIMDRMDVEGKELAPTKAKKYKYLQSESNIQDENYKLRASATPKKIRTWLITLIVAVVVGIGLGATALGCDIAFLFNQVAALKYGILVAALIFILAGIGISAFSIIKIINLRKALLEEKKNPDEFKKAEKVTFESLDDLFEREFESYTLEEEEEETKEEEDDLLAYVDKNFTFEKACKQFMVFANERGLSIDYSISRVIFASIATSRLLLVKAPQQVFDLFVKILNAYLGSPTPLQDVSQINSPIELFYTKNGSKLEETVFAKAISRCLNNRMNAQFIGLRNVKLNNIDSFLSPLIKYINNPNKTNMCELKGGINRVIEIPSNVWFAMNVCNDENLNALPKHLADIACFITLEAGEGSVKEKKTPVNRVEYPQLQYMAMNSKMNYELDEELWKKIDGLEDLVNKYSPYHMSNKLCMRLEQYVATMLECNAEPAEALDYTIAYKLMPVIIAILHNNEDYDSEKFTESFGLTFGEENITQCQKVLNLSSLLIKK